MDNYIKLENIGSGSTGDVILVKNTKDKKRISIEKDEEERKKITNEILILQTLEHRNIVRYVESFIHHGKVCIIMEYAEKGDLSEHVKMHKSKNTLFEEEILWNYFFQLSEALMYIHSKKIIHRDIKTQNIFMTKTGNIKLGDFGISKTLENTTDFAKSFLGTPYFLSPEICSGAMYNNKSDIWMLGCVLYECASLKRPFTGETFHVKILLNQALMQNIINKDYESLPQCFSNDFRDIIDNMLRKSPESRLSINDLLKLNDSVKKKFKTYTEQKAKIEVKNESDNSKRISIPSFQIELSMNKNNSSKNSHPENLYDLYSCKRLSLVETPMKYQSEKGVNTPFVFMKESVCSPKIFSTNKNQYSKGTTVTTNYLSNPEIIEHKRRPSINIPQSQNQCNKIIDKEFFDSEKQGKLKCIFSKVPKTTVSKDPIMVKQNNIPFNKPNTNEVKEEKKSSNKKQENHYKIMENNWIEKGKNDNNIKPMFNFLRDKIGQENLDKFIDLINFSKRENILKSVMQSDEKIKLLLGVYYKQVMTMIKYVVNTSTDNSPINKVIQSHNTAQEHRKIKSFGSIQNIKECI